MYSLVFFGKNVLGIGCFRVMSPASYVNEKYGALEVSKPRTQAIINSGSLEAVLSSLVRPIRSVPPTGPPTSGITNQTDMSLSNTTEGAPELFFRSETDYTTT